MSTEVSDGGRLKRAFKRFSASSDELEADELQVQSEIQGCQQIKKLNDREVVTVYGHIKNVSVAPRAGTPTLEASVYDGSGIVTLVWLGRRKIAGIRPGVSLVAHGRVSCHDGQRIIFNPRYELQV
jgi:RecG-like helicase